MKDPPNHFEVLAIIVHGGMHSLLMMDIPMHVDTGEL
jgi:hypothetical protein